MKNEAKMRNLGVLHLNQRGEEREISTCFTVTVTDCCVKLELIVFQALHTKSFQSKME